MRSPSTIGGAVPLWDEEGIVQTGNDLTKTLLGIITWGWLYIYIYVYLEVST